MNSSSNFLLNFLKLAVLPPSCFSSKWLMKDMAKDKLSFVLLLYVYHLYCHKIYKELQQGVARLSSLQLRILNEVATIILISVVFLIVLKNQLDWIKGTLGFVGVTVVLMIAVQAYKKFRERKQ